MLSIVDSENWLKAALQKGVLKLCNKCTGEHPSQSVISIKLQSNFIKIIHWYGCSPINLLHIFGTFFYKNTYGGLLLIGQNQWPVTSSTTFVLLYLLANDIHLLSEPTNCLRVFDYFVWLTLKGLITFLVWHSFWTNLANRLSIFEVTYEGLFCLSQ